MRWQTLLVVYIVYFLFRWAFGYFLDNGAYLRVLDVGQGDSILIRTSSGKLILMDGGGGWDADKYLPTGLPGDPCQLDLVVLSHPHDDHLIGLKRIAKRCAVARYLAFPEAKMGDIYEVDGVYFQILWPYPGYKSKDQNNESLVIDVKYRGNEILLTGDVDGSTLCSLPEVPLCPEVLKVSHHGSRTGLCEKIIPEVAIISVGKDNMYGHPSGEVLEFYKEQGVKILRTDTLGTLRFHLPL